MVGNADLEGIEGSESKNLEDKTSSKKISVNSDNGNVVKVEEYRGFVTFSDGDYIEICIRRDKKGVAISRTYSWEKLINK